MWSQTVSHSSLWVPHTSSLTVRISFQEAELNRHLLHMNDSTFPLVFIRALEVFNHLDQHSYIFPPGAKAGLRRLHHPFGTPQVLQAGATFCLLHHSDYLSGYSHDHFMPLWVSYTIQPVVRSSSCDSCGVLVRTVWEGLCFLEQLLSAPAALAFLCVWSALSADDLQEHTRLWESVHSVYCHIRLCVCAPCLVQSI